MSDYDMSIHTNPDADAWAKFFVETTKAAERDVFADVDYMRTWFANAMMAMPMDDIEKAPTYLGQEYERLHAYQHSTCAHLTKPKPGGSIIVWAAAELEALSAQVARLREARDEIRRVDVQAIHAAISRRDWHAVEVASNRLRDKMDRAVLATTEQEGK